MTVPGPWPFALLALAAFRLWRVAARDSITEKAREALTGFDDEAAPPLALAEPAYASQSGLLLQYEASIWREGPPRRSRRYLSALIRCPWCLGFWIALAVAGAWWAFPHVTLLAATPLALSAALGLVKKNLDG